MKREPYLLPSIAKMDEATWRQILAFYLDRASHFRAYFPDDEELNSWLGDFLALPHTSAGEWEGMKGCQVTSAPVTPDARRLFLVAQNPEDRARLWSYELYRNAEMLLRVEDFTLCHVFATKDELRQLQQDGVDIALFEPSDLSANHTPDEQPVPFAAEELEELRKELYRIKDDDELP